MFRAYGAAPAPLPPTPPSLVSGGGSSPIPPGDPTIAPPACLSPTLLQAAQAMCAAQNAGAEAASGLGLLSGHRRRHSYRGYGALGDATVLPSSQYSAAIATSPCTWSVLPPCAKPAAPTGYSTPTTAPLTTTSPLLPIATSNTNLIMGGVVIGALLLGSLYVMGKL